MMKKIKMSILVILLCCCFNISESFALDSVSENIVNKRNELGTALNEAVKFLKVGFFVTNEKLKEEQKSILELEKTAKELKKSSSSSEVNPTILDQGVKPMVKCDYSKEELTWSDDKWKCQDASYNKDCDPTVNEARTCDALEKNCECITEPAGYTVEDGGWGLCNPKNGLETHELLCMLKNKDGTSFQVEDSKCSFKEQTRNCYGEWETTNWSACVREGYTEFGTRKRTVTCDKQFCNPKTKPTETEQCQFDYALWITQVGSCSARCNCRTGRKLFTVTCGGAKCDPNKQPESGYKPCRGATRGSYFLRWDSHQKPGEYRHGGAPHHCYFKGRKIYIGDTDHRPINGCGCSDRPNVYGTNKQCGTVGYYIRDGGNCVINPYTCDFEYDSMNRLVR